MSRLVEEVFGIKGFVWLSKGGIDRMGGGLCCLPLVRTLHASAHDEEFYVHAKFTARLSEFNPLDTCDDFISPSLASKSYGNELTIHLELVYVPSISITNRAGV